MHTTKTVIEISDNAVERTDCSVFQRHTTYTITCWRLIVAITREERHRVDIATQQAQRGRHRGALDKVRVQ